ncbi:hypothetical protein [Pedobacter hartonius]|nr:hypothetical protein [Pedobacter hartonius]
MDKITDETATALAKSGLWTKKFIHFNSGCFFYLELMTGSLPVDIFERLAVLSVYIIDPSRYNALPEFSKGILIGIGRYSEKSPLTKDIDKFNKYVKYKITGLEG